jgi:type III secretion system PrgH/EprH family protein
MFGTDILVLEKEIVFCIGGDEMFPDLGANDTPHAFSQALNTFYIPWLGDSPNVRIRFEHLRVDDDARKEKTEETPTDFTLEVLLEDGSEHKEGKYNTVCRSGSIAFAVKRRNDDWSDEVVGYTRQPSVEPTSSMSTIELERDQAEGRARSLLRKGWINVTAICGLPLLGIAVTALAWWLLVKQGRDQRSEALTMLLAPAPTPNYIVPRGDVINVFNATRDGAQWDRQVLLKAPHDYAVRVTSIGEERQRVEAQLDAARVPFVTVRMTDPSRPTLVMFDGATDEQKRLALRIAGEAMPYSSAISSIDVALGSLDEEAQALLSTAGCPFRRTSRQGGATYLITGALSDESLASLQRLVYQFGQKWGTHCIEFRVQMRTDWLKGKTYRDGSDGYVLLDPASWYFPQPL